MWGWIFLELGVIQAGIKAKQSVSQEDCNQCINTWQVAVMEKKKT